MTTTLTEAQVCALGYLSVVGRASSLRILRTTGTGSAVLQGLAARGLVEPCLRSSYRITDAGREAAGGLATRENTP